MDWEIAEGLSGKAVNLVVEIQILYRHYMDC